MAQKKRDANPKAERLRINLRAVFYEEQGVWIAHCLEMDVMGDGPDRKTAFLRMNGAIVEQIAMSVKHGNRANIFQPADARFFEMYAAGRDAISGQCVLAPGSGEGHTLKNIEIAPVEVREFRGQYALVDPVREWRIEP